MSQSIHDIKLETVDFGWIQETSKVAHLKRAIRLIEQDGNYFSELKDACYQRMEQLDPNLKRVAPQHHAPSEELKTQLAAELDSWEQEVESKQNKGGSQAQANQQQKGLEDLESYFDNEKGAGQQRRKSGAERERLKGNEAIRSKDYQEAIGYYTQSVELDPKMHLSWANRALAHLKVKNFQQCLEDSQRAIDIEAGYSKAYHRKAKALVGLKRKAEAYKTLKEAMKVDPSNDEMVGEMMELWEDMTQEERQQTDSNLISKSEFKKITIEEDSDEEEDEQGQ